MTPSSQSGTTLSSLTFEAGGEASSPQQPTVLSCGGIYFPRRKVPTELRTWKQIIHLPGEQLSAKIFGFTPPDPQEALVTVLQKEGMN